MVKFLFILAGFTLGIGLGITPGIVKPKPIWWRITFILIMSLVVFFSLHPPIAGTFDDAAIAGRANPDALVPVHVAPTKGGTFDTQSKLWNVQVNDVQNVTETRNTVQLHCTESLYNEAGSFQQDLVVYVKRFDNDITFSVESVGIKNPMFTLPFIMGLEERARIMFFHVPAAWIAFIAYVVSMIYGIRYLRHPLPEYDILSSSAAMTGTVFCILATVTGAVWAKFNWGKFWNWDPRQTSIFVLLLVYGAYFALRSAIENPVKRARLSSVYSVLGCIAALFFIYILPRLYDGLHPGSKDSGNAGPVLSTASDSLDTTKQIILSLAYAGFTILFYWIMSLSARTRIAFSKLHSRS